MQIAEKEWRQKNAKFLEGLPWKATVESGVENCCVPKTTGKSDC